MSGWFLPRFLLDVGPPRSALSLALLVSWATPVLQAQDVSPKPAAADLSVKRGLDYLKSTQKPDGAWESGGFGRATSVTSLAVLAFLAPGHVPGEPGPHLD